jgi:hypothetical protein
VPSFLEVFVDNILPIFLVAAIGYVLRRRMHLSKEALSSLTFYGLSPALVFSSLVNSELEPAEIGGLVIFSVLVILAMGLLGLVIGSLARLSREDIVALMIVLMFVNGGNYGLTLNELRYGDEGLARATVYFVVSTIMIFSLGTFLATMGQAGWRDSLRRLIRFPAFYAVLLAMLVYGLAIELPTPLMHAIDLAGEGAIPVMLVVLGMQMADLDGLDGVAMAVPASLLRLIAGPLVALLIAGLLGLQGLSRSTAIIEASTPTAVMMTIMATEFDVRPRMVTGTVVLSTLLSVITIPLVITLLDL